MDNFNLVEFLSNNQLLKEDISKDQETFNVYKVTNNSRDSENYGKKYVGILNYRFDTPEKAKVFYKSKVNDTTTGGGAKALSIDLDKFGLDNFDIETLGDSIPAEKAKEVKQSSILDIPSKEYYNKSALANIGGTNTSVKDLSGKYQVRQLSPNKSYVLVNDEWYDTPKAFNSEVGERFKGGKINQVLSYDEFIKQHPNAKEMGF